MIPPVDDELRLQSLRRGHSGRVFQVEAHYHSNSRQYVVLWDDILEAFPDATNLLNGTLIVTRARDSALRIIEPRCIKHQPGKILEIVGGEELAPYSGGSTSIPAGDTTVPQQLTQRNIEQWAAMTTTEDTLLGGMYAPTICTLTTTTTVPFRPLIVPTETGASSTRDDSDQEEDKEDETDKTHVHIGASGFNQLGVSLSPSLYSSTHNNGKNGDTIGSLTSSSGPKSPTSLPLSSIAYPVPKHIPPPPPAATKPKKLGFLKSTFYRFVGRTPTKSVSSTSGPEPYSPPAPQLVQPLSPYSTESPTDMSGLYRDARLYRDATMPLYQQHPYPMPYSPPPPTTYTPENFNSTPNYDNQPAMLQSILQNTSYTFLFEDPPTHNSLIPSKVENGPDSPSSDAGSQDSDQTYTSEMRTLEVIARAQAMFDFPGEDCGDLPFKVSDVINIIEFINDDWWRGVLGKEVGIFPSAYVQKLNPPDKGNYPSLSLLIKIRKPASLHSLTEQEDSIHTIHPLVTVESQEF